MAKGDGLFDFSFHWPTNNATVFYPNIYDIYPGLVQGLFNVSNIKEDYNDIIKFSYDLQNGDFSVNNSVLQTNASGTKEAEFVAVYFDADVKLDPLDTQVTGKRFKVICSSNLRVYRCPREYSGRSLIKVRIRSAAGSIHCCRSRGHCRSLKVMR